MNYKELSFAALVYSFMLFIVSVASIVGDKYMPTELFVAGFVFAFASIYFMLLQIEQNTSEKDKEA
jgi:positive regulator of sigma E activity